MGQPRNAKAKGNGRSLWKPARPVASSGTIPDPAGNRNPVRLGGKRGSLLLKGVFARLGPEKRGSDKEDKHTLIKCPIVPMRKALNWRAAFAYGTLFFISGKYEAGPRWLSGQTARLPPGEPGSIPGRVTPRFLHVRIVPDDTADWPVFSGCPVFPALSFRADSTLSSEDGGKLRWRNVLGRKSRLWENDVAGPLNRLHGPTAHQCHHDATREDGREVTLMFTNELTGKHTGNRRKIASHCSKVPAYLQLSSAFEAEPRGRDNGESATHIKYAIAAKHKVLNCRAVFSSLCVYLWYFQRRPYNFVGGNSVGRGRADERAAVCYLSSAAMARHTIASFLSTIVCVEQCSVVQCWAVQLHHASPLVEDGVGGRNVRAREAGSAPRKPYRQLQRQDEPAREPERFAVNFNSNRRPPRTMIVSLTWVPVPYNVLSVVGVVLNHPVISAAKFDLPVASSQVRVLASDAASYGLFALSIVCMGRRNILEVELQQGFRKVRSNREWTMPQQYVSRKLLARSPTCEVDAGRPAQGRGDAAVVHRDRRKQTARALVYRTSERSISLSPPPSSRLRGRSGVMVRPVACHLGEPGSIPGEVTTGFPHAIIVPHDTTNRLMRAIKVNMERRLNEGTGEMGDSRENPPTGIVRHDSHLRKSGDPAWD
ncbi:hypothetical protein PR048_003566 [Dryococelus australis]|uniref:Uncharacterized protein n=1 Tax=Dryococelus australis TaxID=614101 RepID=A0ABQ9IPF8_9NEOP|nr:hypothetical protein PR048_003566 [Dryococelus australis]